MDRATLVNFRVGDLADDLAARGETETWSGRVAKRDLERYYRLLRDELATVPLRANEIGLLLDACNGTLFEPHTYRLLWAQIDDAIRFDRLDAKWAVDGQAFVERLRALSPGQTLALVDAIERAWNVLPTQGFDAAIATAGFVVALEEA